MKNIFLLFLIFNTMVISQPKEIIINVLTSNIPSTELVHITGNAEQLGNWNPSAVPMERKSSDLWSKTFHFHESDTIEFKFTLGSWEHEALNEENKIPANNVYIVEKDTILNFTVNNWILNNSKITVPEMVTGKVEYIKNFKTVGLKPRDIIIWLPPGYEKRNERYPVLYAHDGQNIFDPGTSSFGIDWQMDEAADSLIRKMEIKPIIIVGIYNTPDRYSEYSDNDTGHAYINFIIDDLKPLIDRRYRTLRDKNNTAVIGSSMGGLISFMMVWEYPEIFSKGACLSPPFKYKQFNYVNKVTDYQGARKNLKLFLYNGGRDIELELQPGVDLMASALKQSGYEENFILVTDPDAEHKEAAWAKVFPSILKYFFGTGK